MLMGGATLESHKTVSLATTVLMPDKRCQTRSAVICQFKQHTAATEIIPAAASSNDTVVIISGMQL